eukprot:TRINITY_DN80689_c0_g1_i1.p2 TRINITY_DN80689_c0_g1~~TRINITY_DN80689_c0_g1_i1.p2  ORF type:complete len:154 (+),score=22.52 TRINITY_DN80689_c0_g1_i1:26-463(+)
MVDIIEDLCAPGREVRGQLPQNAFRNKLVGSLSQVKLNMELQGTVTNTVPFGVFVDCGVGTDGLIHISSLKKYVRVHHNKYGDKVEDLKYSSINSNIKSVQQQQQQQGLLSAEDILLVGNTVLVSVAKVDLQKQQLGLELQEIIA